MDAKTIAENITNYNYGELTEKIITKIDFEDYTFNVVDSCFKGAKMAYKNGFNNGMIVGLGISAVVGLGGHVMKKCKKTKIDKLED